MKKLVATYFLLASVFSFAEPLTIITTNAAGSQVDTAIRYLAPAIEQELQRKVIVQNMPGADGLIAMQKFSSMPADGNTLLAGGPSISFSAVMPREYKPQDHFKPLMGIVQAEALLLAPGNSKITDIKSMIAAAKEKGIMGGSSGVASTINFAMMQDQFGVKITSVEYKQSAQIPLDLVAGDLTDVAIAGAGNMAVRSFIASGKLRPIAIIGHSPNVYYKDVKTITQQGYKSMEDFGWAGLFIQNGVPESVKNKLFAGITAAMKSEHGANFEKLQGEPRLFFADSAAITALQKREVALYQEKFPLIPR
jgi:tripartite-type tricarboxylate transporter receptor subunit TctC